MQDTLTMRGVYRKSSLTLLIARLQPLTPSDTVVTTTMKRLSCIGRYNFLFHNCSDYTNMLLDCADIDGLVGQIASEGNGLISIPALREFQLSAAIAIDEFIGAKDNAYANNIGDRIDETLSEIGTYVDAAKEFLAESTNAIVDIGTSLYDGAKNIWNRLFG